MRSRANERNQAASLSAIPAKLRLAASIPEILAGQRLGHDVPGMRGLCAHASPRMKEELLIALQASWEESLRQRAGIHPHSPVPLLDSQLAPFRAHRAIADGIS